MLSRNQLHHWRLFTWDSGRCLHLLFVCNFHAIKSFHCSEWKDVSDCKRASQSMYNRNWRDIKWEVFLRRHRRKGSNSLMKQQYNVTWKIRKNINNYMMRKLKLMASLATWAFCWLMFSQHLKSFISGNIPITLLQAYTTTWVFMTQVQHQGFSLAECHAIGLFPPIYLTQSLHALK